MAHTRLKLLTFLSAYFFVNRVQTPQKKIIVLVSWFMYICILVLVWLPVELIQAGLNFSLFRIGTLKGI